MLFVALVVGSILAYVYRKDIDAAVDKGLKNALEAYVNDEFVRKKIDMMQTKVLSQKLFFVNSIMMHRNAI